MSSLARRFVLDLRQVRGWVVATGAATFVVVAVFTYSVPFAVAAADSGALSTQAPREPLSFLRVIDPNASIVTVVDDNYIPTLETPGIAVLLDRLEQHPEAFVTLPLRMFTELTLITGDQVEVAGGADNGLVVLGSSPPFLEAAARPGEPILLWGSIAGQTVQVDDNRLGAQSVRQLAARAPDREYVDGTGRTARTRAEPVLSMNVQTARDIGVGLGDLPADITAGVTCYCPAAELGSVADAMTEAELRAGSDRVFYAVDYGGLIGPIERSRAVSTVGVAAMPMAALLGLAVIVVVAARLFWSRRAHAYLVEWVYGARESGLQLRQQLLIALSLTLPAAVGFLALDFVQRLFGTPPPWPPGGGLILLAAAAVLQTIAGTGTAVRVHRLCRHDQQEERYA